MTKTPTEAAVEGAFLELNAIATLIRRPPRDDVELEVDVADRLATAIETATAGQARLQAERDRAVELCSEAAAQFRFYAESHAAKGTRDGDAKAKTNREWAERLSALPPPVKEAEPEPVAWAELAEAVARFLHDEVDLPDKFVDFHWPEHDGDDGFRGDDAWVKIQPIDIVSHYRESAKRIVARFFSTPPALQARGPRDAMLDRSEEEWEALEEATVQVYSLRAGHTLTDDDIAALHLVDRCQREDEESATDAYHRGLETGLRKRGGDELVNLEKRLNDAIISRSVEKAMRGLAEQRADAAEFVLSLCLAALQARVEALEGAAKRLADLAADFTTDAETNELLDAVNDVRAALTGEKKGEADGR